MCRLLCDADVLRECERALSVQQRVVDHLGDAAQLVRVAPAFRAKNLHRRPFVEVGALPKGIDQHGIAGHVREDAEFDLRVVGGNEHVSRVGDERAADLPAERRLDWDVLQVRIAAAQASRRSHRLIEAGVHAAGLRMHQLRQRVDVGALQLHQAAPFEDLTGQLVGERELFQHFNRGRWSP